MFATSPVYTKIKPARAGLTAFATRRNERDCETNEWTPRNVEETGGSQQVE